MGQGGFPYDPGTGERRRSGVTSQKTQEQASPVIVWFRQDLRLADNPALLAAKGPVLPVYILDESPGQRSLGGASRWWLDKSLASLDRSLRALGSRLILRRGPAEAVLSDLIETTGAGAVHWNRLYDAGSIARDTRIKSQFQDSDVECRSFKASLLNEPWQVANGSGDPYRVFTPYWRAARSRLTDVFPGAAPGALPSPAHWPASEDLVDWGLHPTGPDWSSGFAEWRPGEAGAAALLTGFLEGPLSNYGEDRNRPDRTGTSRLSPHLHFGEISPAQIWRETHAAVARGAAPQEAEKFLSEVGWREFHHHLLFYNPDLAKQNFRPEWNRFVWRDDESGFQAWTRGMTGYPIVDAGMRELWATGFMHNRVRMIAASFLIKDLLIDWRQGEAWFWDTLLDADIAQNAANWQWVAGSGADASPYFRIFNPITQGQKFDPDGAYIRRWVPELARLPTSAIHMPSKADPGLLAAAGVRIGRDYPAPMVEHGWARDRALQAYADLKSA